MGLFLVNLVGFMLTAQTAGSELPCTFIIFPFQGLVRITQESISTQDEINVLEIASILATRSSACAALLVRAGMVESAQELAKKDNADPEMIDLAKKLLITLPKVGISATTLARPRSSNTARRAAAAPGNPTKDVARPMDILSAVSRHNPALQESLHKVLK